MHRSNQCHYAIDFMGRPFYGKVTYQQNADHYTTVGLPGNEFLEAYSMTLEIIGHPVIFVHFSSIEPTDENILPITKIHNTVFE